MVRGVLRFVAGVIAVFFLAAPVQAATLVQSVGPGVTATGTLALPSSGVWLITLTSTVSLSGSVEGYAEEHYNYFRKDGFYNGGNDREFFEFFDLENVTTYAFIFKIPNDSVFYYNDFYDYKKVTYYDHGAALFWLTAATPGTATLTVEKIGEAPEPATWGLLILGFACAGAMLRRRVHSLATGVPGL